MAEEAAKGYFLEDDMSGCAKILIELINNAEALSSFFNDSNIKNSYKIFRLGNELNKSHEGKKVMQIFMNGNVRKIVQGDYSSLKIKAQYGQPSYLCVNQEVKDGKMEWAIFGTSEYIGTQESCRGGDKLHLIPLWSQDKFQVQCKHGAESFLAVNQRVTGAYQQAFFGTSSFISDPKYRDGQHLRLHPIYGGEFFQIEAFLGKSSYLFVDGQVGINYYQWAFFGTKDWIDANRPFAEKFNIVFE